MSDQVPKLSNALLFDEVPCFISIQHRDGRILRTNRRFREEFGERIGDFCYRAYKHTEQPCPVCPMAQTFEDRQRHHSEEIFLSRYGMPIHVTVSTAPLFDEAGELVAVLEMANDVTASKRLQRELEDHTERYRTLFNEVPCYISIQNRDLRIVDSNRRFKDEFGDLEGGHCYEVYKHREERCEICPVARTFEDGEVHSSEEIVTSREGLPIDVLVYTAPIRDRDGQITAVMEMSTNITDLRKMQSQLTSVGELVAGLAHTVKGIVMGLDGGMYVVESGFKHHKDDVVQKGWEMVQRNVERVSHLVLDMLYYAKDRAPDKQEVQLDRLCHEVCDLFTKKLEESQIMLRPEVAELGSFWGDPKSIHTLLLNLLENAIHACRWDSSKTTHTIGVRLRDVEHAIEICVSDDGVGMDQETQSKLFSAMYSTKRGGGTGFGLLVAKKIVDEHNGQISVESAPGKGAQFCVRLPRREATGERPDC